MDTTTPTPARRPWRRIAATGALTATLALGGVTAWALDRYVIEHVEIADVAAYEEAAGTSADTSSADASSAAASGETSSTAQSSSTSTDTAEPTVTVTEHEITTSSGTATVYVADVVVSDITQLRAAFAQNAFGANITADTSDIATDVGALLAINGDYYGFRSTGVVIRNGVLYRDSPARTAAVIYRDGTMDIVDETTTSGEQLLADGAWQTYSFGPALVEDGAVVEGIGEVEIDTNVGNHSIQGAQPRTAIGMIEANHYVLVVVDGRSSESSGVTMTELADLMLSLGATEAYNLDGGGSSTMVDADGSLVNDPLGRGNERGTSDILYVASTETTTTEETAS
ncbi:phosphodiester glycosidase family protein [Salana multivorans]